MMGESQINKFGLKVLINFASKIFNGKFVVVILKAILNFLSIFFANVSLLIKKIILFFFFKILASQIDLMRCPIPLFSLQTTLKIIFFTYELSL